MREVMKLIGDSLKSLVDEQSHSLSDYFLTLLPFTFLKTPFKIFAHKVGKNIQEQTPMLELAAHAFTAITG